MKLLRMIQIFNSMAWRNVWRQKKRSYLVMSTALVGMFGIIFFMGWINGMFDAMLSGAIDTGLGHIQIRPQGYDKARKITMKFKEPIEVKRIIDEMGPISRFNHAARFEREGMLRLGSFNRGVLLMGIEPESEAKVTEFDSWINEGQFLSPAAEKDGKVYCLIGHLTALKMEVGIGDSVILSTADLEGETRSIRAVVKGIFNSPVAPVDKYTVILRREDLSNIFSGSPDNISTIVFRGEQDELIDGVAANIRDQLAAKQIGEKVEVLTLFQLQAQLKVIIDLTDQIMDFVNVIFLSGFALTLLNSIMMSIFDRMREIGIQRAIGARAGEIIIEILIESFYISLIGSGAGFILGAIVTYITAWTGISLGGFAESLDILGNMNSVIYPYLTWDNVIYAFVLATVISLVAGFYPAWKASRIDPVKAIQNK